MATLVERPKVEVTTLLGLDELELRGLKEMTEWGNKAILESLQKGLSASLIEKHGAALERFFNAIREHGGGIISRAEAARKAFNK